MRPQYLPVVQRFLSDKPAAKALASRLHLRRPTPKSLMGLSHADIVLALLRLNNLGWVEAFIGKPITKCPCRRFDDTYREKKLKKERARREGDDRRVLLIGPNPRMPGSKIHYRYSLMKPGLTISQLLVRGCKRREINGNIRKRRIIVEGSL